MKIYFSLFVVSSSKLVIVMSCHVIEMFLYEDEGEAVHSTVPHGYLSLFVLLNSTL